MAKCKYPNEVCANMTVLNGNTYCDSVPCSLKDELPKQTNADRIRAMNDKELEKFLSMCVSDCQGRKLEKREFCKGCPFDTGAGYCTDKRIKKWLQSEAE